MSRFQILIGSLGRSDYFFNQNDIVLIKKSQRVATGSQGQPARSSGSHRVFSFFIFFQSSPVLAPDQSTPGSRYQTRPSFKTIVKTFILIFHQVSYLQCKIILGIELVTPFSHLVLLCWCTIYTNLDWSE